jgi:hypothetical protein
MARTSLSQAVQRRITGIRCGRRPTSGGNSDLIVREAKTIDILVNSAWGGYERMVEDGNTSRAQPWQIDLHCALRSNQSVL